MKRYIELAGFGIGCTGWLCSILTRFLPMWNITGPTDNVTTVSVPMYWGGIWLSLEEHNNLHCSFYQSMMSLSGSFRSWQALLTAAICVGLSPVVLYVVGLVKFPQRVQVKAASGAAFLVSGLLLLVVSAWTTHSTAESLNSALSLKREWGIALYFGWVGTALLMVGGGVLCINCCKAEQQDNEQRQEGQRYDDGASYPLQNYATQDRRLPYPEIPTVF
ncbi:claudin-4-like [Chanos chanos]|uniref:Claudin-4-like n=1 Tax=Chanos chanos TaxID=29144 RepID=A0A6J2VP80_CHACN|nr:claudin-4-like [Chanos chanos]